MNGDNRDLAFEVGEYHLRLAAVREQLGDEDVLLVFTPENVNYLTGYETIGYSSYLCLIVPAEGSLRMVVRDMELEAARTTTWLDSFVTVADNEDAVDRTIEALADADLASGTVALELTSPFLTVTTYQRLTAALGEERCRGRSGLVERGRRIKSPAEIEYTRAACRFAEEGMRAALVAVAAGVTENEVSAAAYQAMVGGGSDFLASDPIVTSGWRSGVAHTTFGGRTLAQGDTVLIELGACRRRYFGALMRTASVGTPTPEISRVAGVLEEALEAAIDAIRSGVTSAEVDAACRQVIDRNGYGDWFRKRTGYSMGVAFAPDWGEGHIVSLRKDDDTVLESGMVFHIPPAIRKYQQFGVGLSESVMVTDSGCEVLTNFSRRLVLS
ncbi:MAG: Xaa-Pro peptidase family protein [Actinomycetota bacterium]|nr:Xaa-Pro peptidase family protein [Actinomycetota bacterium]